MPDASSYDYLTPRQVAANIRFASACDKLAQATAALRAAETEQNQRNLAARQLDFAEALKDRGK
jgi:hypothetical protein